MRSFLDFSCSSSHLLLVSRFRTHHFSSVVPRSACLIYPNQARFNVSATRRGEPGTLSIDRLPAVESSMERVELDRNSKARSHFQEDWVEEHFHSELQWKILNRSKKTVVDKEGLMTELTRIFSSPQGKSQKSFISSFFNLGKLAYHLDNSLKNFSISPFSYSSTSLAEKQKQSLLFPRVKLLSSIVDYRDQVNFEIQSTWWKEKYLKSHSTKLSWKSHNIRSPDWFTHFWSMRVFQKGQNEIKEKPFSSVSWRSLKDYREQ